MAFCSSTSSIGATRAGLAAFNADVPVGLPQSLADINAVRVAGDGFMMKQGYTIVWFGWQGDVLPGNNRLTLSVPIAKNADGSSITGIVRGELIVRAPATTLNLSSGWFTVLSHASYPTVCIDNRTALADGFLPTLTVRSKEQDPRVPIPNSDWSFGSCPDGGPATSGVRQICFPSEFQPGRIYELIYRAKDPLVLGLGFAAMRDLAAFLKHEEKDDLQSANPVYRAGNKAVVMGSSQSGRFIRSFLHLGFNADEKGRIAFEGAYPHIGGGLIPINVRFGQPGHAWGDQVNHLYPAYDFPFTYAKQTDPVDQSDARRSRPLHRVRYLPQDFPRRDCPRGLGRSTIVRLDRSAWQKGCRRSTQRANLYYGQHSARFGATAVADCRALWRLPATAKPKPAGVDHAGTLDCPGGLGL